MTYDKFREKMGIVTPIPKPKKPAQATKQPEPSTAGPETAVPGSAETPMPQDSSGIGSTTPEAPRRGRPPKES